MAFITALSTLAKAELDNQNVRYDQDDEGVFHFDWLPGSTPHNIDQLFYLKSTGFVNIGGKLWTLNEAGMAMADWDKRNGQAQVVAREAFDRFMEDVDTAAKYLTMSEEDYDEEEEEERKDFPTLAARQEHERSHHQLTAYEEGKYMELTLGTGGPDAGVHIELVKDQYDWQPIRGYFWYKEGYFGEVIQINIGHSALDSIIESFDIYKGE
jgi:hypothetical protein